VRQLGIHEGKSGAMAEVKERAEALAGEICGTEHPLVWGEGSLDARIAIVGEAPGDKEEKMQRPFVGPAGRLLDRELEGAGLDRPNLWITNVVKCRPTRSSAGGLVNRPPTAKEVNEWLSLLEEELKVVSPKVIICAGAVAANAIIHKDFQITKERGQWFISPLGPMALATFHPAYILRQLDDGWERAIEAFRSDLHTAAEPIKKAA
jgi:uracil-DNA glycosylase